MDKISNTIRAVLPTKLSSASNVTIFAIFAVAWALLGLAAFIYSFMCVYKTASPGKIVIGLLMAIFLGPFYWIYWFADKQYCRTAKSL